MDPGMRLVTGWGATPTSPAPPDCCACAVRKVKGCASLLGVCGPPRPAEAGPELPCALLAPWPVLAEDTERFLFQQSG